MAIKRSSVSWTHTIPRVDGHQRDQLLSGIEEHRPELPSIRYICFGYPDMYMQLAGLTELEEIVCDTMGGWEVTDLNEHRFLEPMGKIYSASAQCNVAVSLQL